MPSELPLERDFWTLVSTPEYAMECIQETPMQDPETGAFVPQPPEYLHEVPGPDLEAAFQRALSEPHSVTTEQWPATVYLHAQQWGSALPAHRHLDIKSSSPTRRVIAGIAYDSGRAPLAPTHRRGEDEEAFVRDKDLLLYQAGDMVLTYMPGAEGAAISGMDVAEDLLDRLLAKLR